MREPAADSTTTRCSDCDSPADALYVTHCRACARERKRHAMLAARRVSQSDFVNALRECLGLRPLAVECFSKGQLRRRAAERATSVVTTGTAA